MLSAMLFIQGCPGDTEDLCAGVTCAAGRYCSYGDCIQRTCTGVGDCTTGSTCVNGKCVPVGPPDAGSPDTPVGDAASPAPDLGACGSSCDDKDPCTIDTCQEGKCINATPVPTTCGNTAIDACEICEGTQPLGVDQLCAGCNEIGKKYYMYMKSWDESNAFFRVETPNGDKLLKVTCYGKRVITKVYGICEDKSLPKIVAGGVGQKTVTIGCSSYTGYNKSEYKFLCGPAHPSY